MEEEDDYRKLGKDFWNGTDSIVGGSRNNLDYSVNFSF